jgi:hypothetical protein
MANLAGYIHTRLHHFTGRNLGGGALPARGQLDGITLFKHERETLMNTLLYIFDEWQILTVIAILVFISVIAII